MSDVYLHQEFFFWLLMIRRSSALLFLSSINHSEVGYLLYFPQHLFYFCLASVHSGDHHGLGYFGKREEVLGIDAAAASLIIVVKAEVALSMSIAAKQSPGI